MNPSPGYTTTEFWSTAALTLVNQVIALLAVFNLVHWTPAEQGAVIAVCESVTGVVIAIYTISRSNLKAAVAPVSAPPAAPVLGVPTPVPPTIPPTAAADASAGPPPTA